MNSVKLTPLTFNEGIEKLKGVYGERYFPAQRCDMIFRKIQGVESKVFLESVDRIIADRMTAPNVEQFLETVWSVQREMNTKNDDGPFDRYWPYCIFCSNQGFIFAEHRQLNSSFMFACPKCARAKHMSPPERKIVFWDRKWLGDYKPLRSNAALEALNAPRLNDHPSPSESGPEHDPDDFGDAS